MGPPTRTTLIYDTSGGEICRVIYRNLKLGGIHKFEGGVNMLGAQIDIKNIFFFFKPKKMEGGCRHPIGGCLYPPRRGCKNITGDLTVDSARHSLCKWRFD